MTGSDQSLDFGISWQVPQASQGNKKFKRAHGILYRNDNDKVIRGNSTLVQKLVLRIEEEQNLIEIIRVCQENPYSSGFDSTFIDKLVEKCVEFVARYNDFVLNLFNEIDIERNQNMNFFQAIVLKSNSAEIILRKILEKDSFDELSYFIAHIVDEKTIKIVLDWISENKLENNVAEKFRNYVGNINSRSIAETIHSELESMGYSFSEAVLTEFDTQEYAGKSKQIAQRNLDNLFSYETLSNKVKDIFENSKTELSLSEFHDVGYKWYDINGHGSPIDWSFRIIQDVLGQRNKVLFDEVDSLIKSRIIDFTK